MSIDMTGLTFITFLLLLPSRLNWKCYMGSLLWMLLTAWFSTSARFMTETVQICLQGPKCHCIQSK